MNYITAIAIVLVCLSLLYDFLRKRSKLPKNFPPGPWGLPILGSWLEFRAAPLTSLLKWKKEHGDVVGFQLGSYRFVLLSGVSTMKEAFTNIAFNGRPPLKPFQLFAGGEEHGTLTSEGAAWDEVRRFTVRTLNNLSFGKRGTENLILDGADMVVKRLRGRPDSVVLHDELLIPLAKYTLYLLTGDVLNSSQYMEIETALHELHWSVWKPIGSVIWFLPWLADMFPRATGYVKAKRDAAYIHTLVRKSAESHKEALLPEADSEQSANLVEAFVAKIANHFKDTESNFHGGQGDRHMKGMTSNLLVTAIEALSNTLNWALIYLCKDPEVQQKLQEEIERVVGSSASVTLEDMQSMPYTGAFMKEVFRIASTSPFSNFQQTTSDAEFHGYSIPRDTIIIGNIYGAHYDETIWEEPEAFRPERFLGENAASAPPIIPFSVGLRTCIGQTYARNVLFIYLVTLCQNFEFAFDLRSNPVPTHREVADDALISVFRFAKFYKFNCKARSQSF